MVTTQEADDVPAAAIGPSITGLAPQRVASSDERDTSDVSRTGGPGREATSDDRDSSTANRMPSVSALSVRRQQGRNDG